MAAKRVVLFGELGLVFMSVDDAMANRVLDTSVHILTRDQPQVATINRRKAASRDTGMSQSSAR